MTRATTEERSENSIMRYLRETRAELAKVSWPTREEGTRLTVIVLITTIIAAIVIFGIDSIFSALIRILVQMTG
jgi:preprotein translocase subunit SecE